MGSSLKRYRCPQCDKVSDGTGLSAHMIANGHVGERIQVADAKTPGSRKPTRKPTADLVRVEGPVSLSFKPVGGLMLIQASDGSLWIAEKVRG